MRVTIQNGPDNWLKAGRLVREWISDPKTRPADTAALQTQLNAAHIIASVPLLGKPLDFISAGADHNEIITIPTLKQVVDAESLIAVISNRPPGQREYPIPMYYSIIFGAAPKVDLSASEAHNMVLRRLGELVLDNEFSE